MLGYPSGQGGNWEWELQIHLHNRAEFCEEESFGWKIHALEASLTCKDDNSFRNGSVDECYSLKASQLAKFILVTNTSDVEKIKNRGKQNFKDEANNLQLDKEEIQLSVLAHIDFSFYVHFISLLLNQFLPQKVLLAY